MRTFPLLIGLAFLATGCLGKGGDVAPAGTTVPTNGTNGSHNVTLPDRAGVCNGCVETNKTENGSGGSEHKHDYWKSREQIVVFSGNVPFYQTPLLPDGEGSNPKSVAYVKLPQGSLVYEGAEKVVVRGTPLWCPSEVVADTPDALAPCQPSGDAPAISFQYRTAADGKWRDAIALPAGSAVELKVKPEETDMPHSVSSLWVFRITTDKPSAVDALNLTLTIVKGRDVVNWPGHPNFYADSNVRKIADAKHVKTHMSGVAGSQLYDQGGTWATPDKLVSYGTGKLLVIVNVTNAVSQTGQAPTTYFLETHNATIIGPEIQTGARYHEKDGKNDLKSYQFEVNVTSDGMDGPYQPESRWGFRAMATFADTPVALPEVGKVGLCPGCFDYDIEYDLTIFAIHTDDASGMMM